jgi:hypothetical protein
MTQNGKEQILDPRVLLSSLPFLIFLLFLSFILSFLSLPFYLFIYLLFAFLGQGLVVYIAQAGLELELTILLSKIPECWDYR